MTQWMSVTVLALVACGKSPDPQWHSSESELLDPRKEACHALAGTIESHGSTINTQTIETLLLYQLAYCSEPDSELATGIIGMWDYCVRRDRRATDDCMDQATPLIDCLANNPTADPASVCAAEWLGEACLPPPFESETYAADGLMSTCSSSSQRYVAEDGTEATTLSLPASLAVGTREDPVCADGHSYEIQCRLPLTCEMACTCIRDGVVTRTVTLTEPDFSRDWRNTEIEACGWIP